MNPSLRQAARGHSLATSAGSFRASSAIAARNPQRGVLARGPRLGVSLLEVLIAMFVMLFGLMGVAAIFPVGNHYAGKGDQYDRGAALAGSAFAEVKARGMMQPGFWLRPDGATVMNNGVFRLTGEQGHAFVVDPLGAAQTTDPYFPFGGGGVVDGTANPWRSPPTPLPALPGANWPIRRVTFAANPNASAAKMDVRIASAITRLRDDVAVELPDQGDRPGIQRWYASDVDDAGNPNHTPEYAADDTPLARAYTGSYSWLATVLPVSNDALFGLQAADPRHRSFLYEVSVAVFHKREDVPSEASERSIPAELGPGGDLMIYAPNYDDVEAASQDIRPGQWIALCGVHPSSGKFLLRWYRLLSFDDETDDFTGPNPLRRAMVEGPDWPTRTDASGASLPATDLRAILLPGVIGVSTQTLQLETD
ncbi:MAG TPA: hypothetical protein VEQ85_05370 [Lacipirellulaceae bacterium]|nr:hypothetical protein [Lacipirellulaceae bacterium]